jgi:YVTN family beta-propeller protein
MNLAPAFTVVMSMMLFAAGQSHAAPFRSSLLAVDRDGDQLIVLDPATLAIHHRITTGNAPHEVVGNAKGTRAYVANYGDQQQPGSTISVIDLKEGRELQRIDVRPYLRPHGMKLVDNKLYFTSEATRSIARLDVDTLRVDWVVGVGQSISHMLDTSADGRHIYTTNMFSDSVTAIDSAAPPNQPLRHTALGRQPEGLALSPDGKQLWVGQNGEGRIAVIDTTTMQVIEQIDAGKYPARVRFSPDGKYAFAADPATSELLVFDAATRKVAHRIAIPGQILGILPTPDARHVHLTLAASAEIATVELGGFTVVRKAHVGQVADGLGWAGP